MEGPVEEEEKGKKTAKDAQAEESRVRDEGSG
jgi:hypothetical protein